MKHLLTFRRLAVGGLLLCAAHGSLALTLGRVRGVALIGRPLDVVIQATLDAGADSAAICVLADVFQGDTRVAENRVSAQLEISSGTDAAVRVRTAVVVDEPVVTVYLRVGCGQAVTRRYVMLAEPAGDASPIAPAVPAPAAPAFSAAAQPAGPAPASGRGTPAASISLATIPEQRRPSRRAEPGGGAQALRAAPALRASRAPIQSRPAPRLKLDPLDLAAERATTLRPSARIDALPEVTPAQRAQAAATWKALNAGPEDILRNTQRMGALEADVKLLMQQIQSNNKALADLNANLESARGERYSNGLVYTLLVLLVLAATALIYRWRGVSRQWEPAEWNAREQSEEDTRLGAQLLTEELLPAASAENADPALDLDLSQAAVSRANLRSARVAQPHPNAAARLASVDFQSSQPASMRSVKAEELNDVQQQADFFISLGEHEQAINVLMSHIQANPQTSALAWLDLLDLHHRLNRRDGYDALRDQFQQRFNVQVPPFDAYRLQTAGLEAYVDAMSRICALWPSPKVLDVIEDSIFRKPGSHGGAPFDLAAYRELLLLYNLGKEVIDDESALDRWDSSGDSLPSGLGFSSTSINPLSVSLPQPAWRVRQQEGAPEPVADLQVDIDLEDLAEVRAPVPDLRQAGSANESSGRPENLIDFDAFDTATARLARRNPSK